MPVNVSIDTQIVKTIAVEIALKNLLVFIDSSPSDYCPADEIGRV